MALAEQIRIHIGRPLGEIEKEQAELWEGWIRADIEAAARRVSLSVSQLDPTQVERFLVAAIARRMTTTFGVRREDVAVDDGRVSYTYDSPQMEYLPEWWAWLGLPDPHAATGAGWSGSISYAR